MSTDPSTPAKPKRRYRRITPAVVAQTVAVEAREGNVTAAIRRLEPDAKNPAHRGYSIKTKANDLIGAEYVARELEQIAVSAIDRVGELVGSTDEKIATKNAHFVIDHTRGKAVQRTESRNVSLNIQTVLE